MIADAIQALVNKPGFKVAVFPGEGNYLELGANDEAILTTFLLRRNRLRSGLTLSDVAKRLGARSVNSCARYEQGRSVPTVPKLTTLLAAVAHRPDFVLCESRT